MSIIEHLQELDALVIKHTLPPATPILRAKIQVMAEQIEAYQASSDKQDETLARQAAAIKELMEDKAASDARVAEGMDNANAKRKAAADAVYEDLYRPQDEP